MNPSDATPWDALFPAPCRAEHAVTLRCRLIRKHGQPLLLVPVHRAAIGDALALYPAQTARARLARTLLGASLRAGLALGTEPVVLRLDPQAAFPQFLGAGGADVFSLAMLCGNPLVPGRRFVLLVFDSLGRPKQLVKVGLGGPAMAKIRAEAAALKSLPSDVLSAPAMTGEFEEAGVAALALEYAPGKNPDPREVAPLATLLESWLHTDRKVRLLELPCWQRLAAVSQTPGMLRRLEHAFGSATFHPAIHHGDLAPWNIRVNAATHRWVVLDWERGEPAGPPGWDWFHFVIQTELLVRRAEPEAIARRIEALLQSASFGNYARQAGVEHLTRPLVLAYLLHCAEVLPPPEGVGATRELLNLLSQRWPPG